MNVNAAGKSRSILQRRMSRPSVLVRRVGNAQVRLTTVKLLLQHQGMGFTSSLADQPAGIIQSHHSGQHPQDRVLAHTGCFHIPYIDACGMRVHTKGTAVMGL